MYDIQIQIFAYKNKFNDDVRYLYKLLNNATAVVPRYLAACNYRTSALTNDFLPCKNIHIPESRFWSVEYDRLQI